MREAGYLCLVMKKAFFLFLVAVCCLSLSAVSLKSTEGSNSFDSEVMLGGWDFSPSVSDAEDLDSYHIDLVTTTKGDDVYSWFGHSGLMITYPDGRQILFDYGLFAFDDDFYGNFAMGRLWYSVSASYARYHISDAQAENRTVSYVRLKLSPEKKKAVINFLANNVQPENSHYLYHYYLDNCATRIRDIINYAVDGQLKTWSEVQAGTTFRKEADRCLSVNAFWDYLLNFLQSGQIDQPISLWDEMFLPAVLEKAVIDFGLSEEQGVLVDNTATETRMPSYDTFNLQAHLLIPVLVSLFLCALLVLFARKGWRVAYGTLSFVIYLVLGLLGCLLFFMSLFTNHSVTWFNENLLFVNPVLLVFAFSNLRFARKKTKTFASLRKQDQFLMIICGILVLLKFIFPKVFCQYNIQQLLTIVPIYAIKAFVRFKPAQLGKGRKKVARKSSYSSMI